MDALHFCSYSTTAKGCALLLAWLPLWQAARVDLLLYGPNVLLVLFALHHCAMLHDSHQCTHCCVLLVVHVSLDVAYLQQMSGNEAAS
jgi:hypothetical protein